MYICMCQAVTEEELRAAVAAGAVTLKDLRRQLQVASCCGGCTERVKACLRSTLRQQAVSAPLRPEFATSFSI
jgi:bacterioferritin-associated ferredoxin